MIAPLNDTEKLVLNCKIMRLREKEALAYLKVNGHEIKERRYYEIKGKLEAEKLKRLHFYAEHFDDMHLERIETLEWAQKEMVDCAIRESNPLKRVMIIEKIVNLQPYLSAYVEATKEVMEGSKAKSEAIDLSNF
jgi:hypothetical protein